MGLSSLALLAFAPPPDGQQPSFFSFLPIIAVFGVFYFVVFAPMRRKQKKHSEMLTALKAGDRVVTTGGIFGTVVGVSDAVVQLRIADQVKIEITKSAVADRLGDA